MAYNPLRDPYSSYNNPKKGPHNGTPTWSDGTTGIPLRGDLSPEQEAWMNKGRQKPSDWRSMGQAQRRRMGAPSSHLEAALAKPDAPSITVTGNTSEEIADSVNAQLRPVGVGSKPVQKGK